MTRSLEDIDYDLQLNKNMKEFCEKNISLLENEREIVIGIIEWEHNMHQRCSNCGGVLEKWRVRGRPETWKCLSCRKSHKQEINYAEK